MTHIYEKSLLLFCFVYVVVPALSQRETSIVKFSNPTSVWVAKGFSQSSIIDLGNCKMVFISGQVPLDSNGVLVGKADMAKQTEQVFLNIRNILADAGSSMNDIVKLSIYIKDISQLQKFRQVRDKFIDTAFPPASTVVEVSKLFRDDVLLEVDATAVIKK